MEKQVYLTTYKSKKYNDTFRSYVLATSEEEAKSKMLKRNIGEVLEDSFPLPLSDYPRISAVDLFDKAHYRHCLHAVTFMAYVLASAGKIDATEALSDQGIVHEILHLATDVYNKYDQFVNEVIRKDLIVFQNLFDEITH